MVKRLNSLKRCAPKLVLSNWCLDYHNIDISSVCVCLPEWQCEESRHPIRLPPPPPSLYWMSSGEYSFGNHCPKSISLCGWRCDIAICLSIARSSAAVEVKQRNSISHTFWLFNFDYRVAAETNLIGASPSLFSLSLYYVCPLKCVASVLHLASQRAKHFADFTASADAVLCYLSAELRF